MLMFGLGISVGRDSATDEIDPHSLGKWRVDGALPHITAWYDAFWRNRKDKLFLPAEQRASIW